MKDYELLNTVYQNATSGSLALGVLLPAVKNEEMRICILRHIDEYDTMSKLAGDKICIQGNTPKKIGPFKTASMVIGIKMNTAINSTNNNFAKMIIKGSDMGVCDVVSAMNKYKNSSPDAVNLAKMLVNSESCNIETFKSFL